MTTPHLLLAPFRFPGSTTNEMGKISDIELPPSWVLNAARAELRRTNHWIDYYHVLTAYYKVTPLKRSQRDSNLPPDVVAVYRPSEPCVLTRAPSMTEQTALHELFHHLVKEKSARPKQFQAEQALADAFAAAVLGRADFHE